MNFNMDLMDGSIAKVTLELFPSDYQDELDKELQKHRKEISMPGFRKGKVPMEVVRKQFGDDLLEEVVDKIINREMNAYVQSKGIELIRDLGPLLINSDAPFDPKAERHTFVFEIAQFPEFSLDLDAELAKVPSYKIVVTEADLDKEVDLRREEHGEDRTKEIAEKGDLLLGVFFSEEHNFESETDLNIRDGLFGSPEILQQFIGKKPGDVVRALPAKSLFAERGDLEMYLGLSEEEAAEDLIEPDVELDYRIDEIMTTEPIGIGPELYSRVFPDEEIADYEQFREHLRKEMEDEEELASEEQARFLDDVIKHLKSSVSFDLPPREHIEKVFALKREEWEEDAPEVATEDYLRYEDTVREGIIFSKISKQYALDASGEEIADYAVDRVARRMMIMGEEPTPKKVEKMMKEMLSDSDEVINLLSDLELERVAEFIKGKAAEQQRREISYFDFWEDYDSMS